MTLRLTDEQDAVLTAWAAKQGASKNEAVIRALRQVIDQDHDEAEVRRLTREATDEYGPLLDRLASWT